MTMRLMAFCRKYKYIIHIQEQHVIVAPLLIPFFDFVNENLQLFSASGYEARAGVNIGRCCVLSNFKGMYERVYTYLCNMPSLIRRAHVKMKNLHACFHRWHKMRLHGSYISLYQNLRCIRWLGRIIWWKYMLIWNKQHAQW